MSYTHLKRQERYGVYHLKLYGLRIREIARRLGRSASTISRELRRNTGPFQCVYWHESAQEFATRRRAQALRPSKKRNRALYRQVTKILKQGWSPALCSGRLKRTYPQTPSLRLSHETLYRWVYADAAAGGQLYQCLVRAHKKRRRQRNRLSRRGLIPNRVGIEQRPAIVDTRHRIGDWESDTLEGAKGKGALATHVERKSRYLVAAKLKDKRAETYSLRTEFAFRKIPGKCRKTMTVDNGKEFAQFKTMEQQLGIMIYFADPYAAWQRGTNENTNGLLRRYFPKGTDFTQTTYQAIARVVQKLNNRPRKCLDYRTPREVFFNIRTVALQM